MAIDDQLAVIKTEIHGHRHHCLAWHRLSELERLIAELEAMLGPCRQYFTPASARFTAFLKGSVMPATTFASGATIDLVGDVKNSIGVDIPDAVTWSADQGTLTVDPNNPENATLTGVPDGQVNVTMTTTPGANGQPIVIQHTYTVTDLLPASADFTATAA